MIYYAGIGSRETPMPVQDMMHMIAATLAKRGDMCLRSGGAAGADTAFEVGAVNAGARAMDRTLDIWLASDGRLNDRHFELAAAFHPNWDACNEHARKLHARNGAILYGANLDMPVSFVVCWTKNGGATGGTGQALRIAAHYGLPVFNLFYPEHNAALWQWINTL